MRRTPGAGSKAAGLAIDSALPVLGLRDELGIEVEHVAHILGHGLSDPGHREVVRVLAKGFFDLDSEFVDSEESIGDEGDVDDRVGSN